MNECIINLKLIQNNIDCGEDINDGSFMNYNYLLSIGNVTLSLKMNCDSVFIKINIKMNKKYYSNK